MKLRRTLVTLSALAAIGFVCLWAYRYEQRRERAEICPFCDRMVHPMTTYQVKVGNRILTACCPRCGIRAQLNQSQKPGTATDLNTGEKIRAESAVYVEGGDIQYCTHGTHPVAREPNGVSLREYDRCLPTLVAFKTQSEADAYRDQHGGRVLSYAQALESVKQQ